MLTTKIADMDLDGFDGNRLLCWIDGTGNLTFLNQHYAEMVP